MQADMRHIAYPGPGKMALCYHARPWYTGNVIAFKDFDGG